VQLARILSPPIRILMPHPLVGGLDIGPALAADLDAGIGTGAIAAPVSENAVRRDLVFVIHGLLSSTS